MKNEVKRQKAITALEYITSLLERYNFRWCISGSLACNLYGVKRPITAIDIDVETTKDDPKFKQLLNDVHEHTRLPFQLWIDKNYDNWVTNVVINGQLLSICTTQELKLFNKETGIYDLFYKNGIPDPVFVEFGNLRIPLSPRKSVLRMKEALAHKKGVDLKDIKSIRRIIADDSKKIKTSTTG